MRDNFSFAAIREARQLRVRAERLEPLPELLRS